MVTLDCVSYIVNFLPLALRAIALVLSRGVILRLFVFFAYLTLDVSSWSAFIPGSCNSTPCFDELLMKFAIIHNRPSFGVLVGFICVNLRCA